MRIRGLWRLQAQWARLRGRLTPGPTVLLYHRVTHLPQDPHLLAVTPEHFEEHLLALWRYYRVVSLSELVESLAHGRSPGPVVVLTFDDGYADNAETALPLLKKHRIPATFYLASGFVGSTREQHQDELERLLLLSPECPEQVQLRVAGQPLVWTLRSSDTGHTAAASVAGWSVESRSDPTPRHRAYREICGWLRSLPPVAREAVLAQLHAQCGAVGPARPTHRAMSWEQARQMAVCDLVELGAHTVNHPNLSASPLKEQRAEILGSKGTIEEEIGRPVTSFAYPYGTRQSYTLETVGLLKELGFTNACSNFRGRISRLTGSFQIPRFVVRDWDGAKFLQQIRKGRL